MEKKNQIALSVFLESALNQSSWVHCFAPTFIQEKMKTITLHNRFTWKNNLVLRYKTIETLEPKIVNQTLSYFHSHHLTPPVSCYITLE